MKLVKINIDQNQMLAQQLRIQSIPAVYAFFGGRPVDGFMGAVPESQVKQFVDRLVQAAGGAPGEAGGADDLAAALEHAKQAVAENDFALAAQIYNEVLEVAPDNLAAIAGLARCHAQAGDVDQAKAMLAKVPAKDKTNAEIVAIQASLDLAEQAKAAGPVGRPQGQGRGRPQGFPDPPRSRARLLGGRPAPGGDRRAARHDQARPQLERGGGAPAAAQVLRGAGLHRSAGRRRPQAAVDHPVLVSRGNPFDPVFEQLPDTLPIFPLSGVLLLPGGKLPLNVFEPRYLAMVFDALAGHRMIGMVQPVQPGGYAGDGLPTDDGKPKVHKVGCAGRIVSFNETEDGRLLLALSGVCRFEVGRELELAQGGYRRVSSIFSPYRADLDQADELVELDRERLMAALAAFFRGKNLSTDWDAVKQAADRNLVTSLSMVLPFGPVEKQALLEAADTTARAKLLVAFLEMAAFGQPPDHAAAGELIARGQSRA